MEVEDEENLITILVNGKEESYSLLKDIQDKCSAFIKDIRRHKQKTLEDFKEIIYNIETSSEFNYYFLKFLKENKISYYEDGQKWDYKENLKMLKETLTDEYYKSLGEKMARKNPLEEIINILKYYVMIYKEKLKKKKFKKIKRANKNDKRRTRIRTKKRDNKKNGANKKDKGRTKANKFYKGMKRVNTKNKKNNEIDGKNIINVDSKYNYNTLILKNQLNFQKLNFPLITGIERLRVNYYRDLILEKDITTNCGKMEKYIMNMNEDKDIFNNTLDNIKFNSKTFLLILTLTTTFDISNDVKICNFFTKKFLEDDNKGQYTHIKLLKKGKYRVTTKYEEKIIDENNYILSGLDNDINVYQ